MSKMKKITITISNQNATFNSVVIPIIIVTAILGGYIGTKINHLFSEEQVTMMYSLMMAGLLMTCVFNVVHNIW